MSFIKYLMEMNEFEDQVEDLVDQAKEHEDFEVAMTAINMSKNSDAMKQIISSLSDDEKLVKHALAWFQNKGRELTERASSVEFTPQDIRGLKNEDISDNLMDKLIEWVVDTDPTWMPYGTQKARDDDPYNWVMDRIEEITERILKQNIHEGDSTFKKGYKNKGGGYNKPNKPHQKKAASKAGRKNDFWTDLGDALNNDETVGDLYRRRKAAKKD